MKMLSPNANLWLVLSLFYTVLRGYLNPKTSLTFKLFHSAVWLLLYFTAQPMLNLHWCKNVSFVGNNTVEILYTIPVPGSRRLFIASPTCVSFLFFHTPGYWCAIFTVSMCSLPLLLVAKQWAKGPDWPRMCFSTPWLSWLMKYEYFHSLEAESREGDSFLVFCMYLWINLWSKKAKNCYGNELTV